MLIEILLALLIVSNLILIVFVIRDKNNRDVEAQREKEAENNRIPAYIDSLGNLLAENQRQQGENSKESLTQMEKRLEQMENRMIERAKEDEQKLENIRNTVSASLADMSEANVNQLDKMRNTVDEKLEETLTKRIGESFNIVNNRLEQVYKGLGEMQNLATGVGDLKKVLSNVKTRGVLGEIQLGAILSEILSPVQYEENVRTRASGNERVEFAVKLPGDGDNSIYLPIDSKFPGDTYERLLDAYDADDKVAIEQAGKELDRRIKAEAKDIMTKYVEPPYTTDFGILFLPFEGLYAEVIRRGLLEILSKEYKVIVAGPTTMAALLNSLQMGFKTLAIQKNSSEVWKVLGEVKGEFEKFAQALESAKDKVGKANDELDSLIGTRTRMMQRKLIKVSKLEDSEEIEDNSGMLEFHKSETL